MYIYLIYTHIYDIYLYILYINKIYVYNYLILIRYICIYILLISLYNKERTPLSLQLMGENYIAFNLVNSVLFNTLNSLFK